MTLILTEKFTLLIIIKNLTFKLQDLIKIIFFVNRKENLSESVVKPIKKLFKYVKVKIFLTSQ